MPIAAAATPQAPARRSVPAKKTSPAPARSRADVRRAELEDMGRLGAAICIMRQQYADAGAFHVHWAPFAREAAIIAEDNEQAARIIDYICSAGPYAGIISAALTFGLQIAANHGKIDPDKAAGMGGILSPEILEMRVKAEIESAEKAMKAEAAYFTAESARADAALKEVRAEMNRS